MRTIPRSVPRGLVAATTSFVLALSGSFVVFSPAQAVEGEEVDADVILQDRLDALGDKCPAVAIYLLTGTAPGLENLVGAASASRKNPVPVDFLEGRTSGLEGPTLSPLLAAVDRLLVDADDRQAWKENVLLVDFDIDEYPARVQDNLTDVLPTEPNLARVYSAFQQRQSLINHRLAEKGCAVSPLPLLVGYSQGAGLSTRMATVDFDMRAKVRERIPALTVDGAEFIPPSCAGVFTIPARTDDEIGRATTNCHTPAEQFFVISDPYQNPLHQGNWETGKMGTGIALAINTGIASAINFGSGIASESSATEQWLTKLGVRGDSMCFSGDLICDPSGLFLYATPAGQVNLLAETRYAEFIDGPLVAGVKKHTSYKDDAAKMTEAASRLITKVDALFAQHEDAEKNLVLPLPDAPDVPVDVAIVLDTTESMGPFIGNAKRQATEIIEAVTNRPAGGRVAVVTYRDHYDFVEFRSRVECPFDTGDLMSCIDAIELSPEPSLEVEETVYSGIMTAINDVDWSDSGLRHIIVIGDGAPKDPEPITGLTYESVREALGGLNQSEANTQTAPNGPGFEALTDRFILSVLAEYPPGLFTGLSNPSRIMQNSELMRGLTADSGGTFLPVQLGLQYGFSPSVAPAVLEVIDGSENALSHIPRAFLYTPEAEVTEGAEVFFSGAWSSYAGLDPTFEFDFDGDGFFELRSFQSSVSYSFPTSGQRPVTMRITDEFGRTAVDTITVTVVAAPVSQPETPSGENTFDGSVSVTPRQISSGGQTTISLTGLAEGEQWGFRLVPYSSEDPWNTAPVYASDVFSPLDSSGEGSATVGADFPLGDYRVLVVTSSFRFVDAGRLTVGDREGVVSELFATASTGFLALTMLSFMAFIGLLISLIARFVRNRRRSSASRSTESGSAK